MTAKAKIVRDPGMRSGSPTIEGTRITVTDIVQYYRVDLPELAAQFDGPPDPEHGCRIPMDAIVRKINEALPHLSPEQVRAALVYWRQHEREIQRDLDEERGAAQEARRKYSRLP